MHEQLKERIVRRIESLPDERGYQVLDYIEFLESRYGERSAPTNFFAKLSERVEDTMRAGRIPVKAISGTLSAMDAAGKVMKGVVAAGKSVVDEAVSAAATPPAIEKPKGTSK
ncbi:MAG TPA: hypothetical protein VFI39_09160 [Gemmatimonadales bacterium]|nr:hypothetical protein [Gemmatimonadales bacterium]